MVSSSRERDLEYLEGVGPAQLPKITFTTYETNITPPPPDMIKMASDDWGHQQPLCWPYEITVRPAVLPIMVVTPMCPRLETYFILPWNDRHCQRLRSTLPNECDRDDQQMVYSIGNSKGKVKT
jgi:hypothetical protein